MGAVDSQLFNVTAILYEIAFMALTCPHSENALDPFNFDWNGHFCRNRVEGTQRNLGVMSQHRPFNGPLTSVLLSL